MTDDELLASVGGELEALPGVRAVCLGGSRARGEHRPGSDWDFALYYRGHFDPGVLRALNWDGEVFDVGAWGGGVMNGGAWLDVDGRRVDVHYRDLDDVEHWCAEAEQGRYDVQQLLFYVAGIPTYVVMGELALNRLLHGSLPSPAYPERLAVAAGERWRSDARASLSYGLAALTDRRDVAVALANGWRAILQAGHGRLAERREWVLNEKDLAERAGLGWATDALVAASTEPELREVLGELARRLQG